MRERNTDTGTLSAKTDIPDPYTVFPDNPGIIGALKQAEDLLVRVVGKKIPFSKVRDFLISSGTRDILTASHPLLNNQSPMAVLRTKVESSNAQPNLERGLPVIVRRPTVAREPKTPIERKPTPKRIFEEKQFLRKEPAVVSTRDEVAMWESSTPVLHLAKQDVINLKTINDILRFYPNLHIVEVSRSHLRLVGPGIRKALAGRGIELRIGRIRDADHYDEVPLTRDYLKKKRVFEEMIADPKRKQIFERMLFYEFEEAQMALIYFGDKRMSEREIAHKFGLRETRVQRNLSDFMVWMGVTLRSKRPLKASKFIGARLDYLDRLEKLKTAKEEEENFRNSFRVGDRLPPASLGPQRFEMWQKVYTLYVQNPDVFRQLEVRNPRWFDILVHYFQLEETDGTRVSAVKLGSRHGVSHQRILQLKNEALEFLGLLEME